MPERSVATAAPIAQIRRNRAPVLAGVVGKMVLKEVRNQAAWDRCRLTNSPGRYERMAGADAIKPARNVMSDALGAQSARNVVALQRTLDLFGPDSVEPVGPVLVENLTTLGASRAGLAELMREGSRADLAPLLAKLDACIVEIGIKAGNCKGIPDAVLRDSSSGKLCDAVAAAKKVMLECAGKVGSRELLRGIAQSVLPRSIAAAVQERLSHSADKLVGAVPVERLMDVLMAQGADKIEQRIVQNLENGGAESFNAAILNVLKIAECVVQAEPGGNEDAPPASKPPHEAPQWLRDHAANGAPILYNVVSNDGSARSNCSHGCGMQLEHVRNLLNDAREDAYERGRLTEIVRFQEHHIDRLERELQAERERNGSGEIRARKLRNERLDTASTASTPPDEQLDLIPDNDAESFHANRMDAGVDQTDNSERPPQRREQLNKASNSTLPPESDLDQIHPVDRARAQSRIQTDGTDRIDDLTQQRRDPVLYPSNRVVPPGAGPDRTPDQDNGDGLVRRRPGGEDQTDQSNRTPPQKLLQNASNGVVPPGDELGDVPPLDIDLERANLKRDESDRPDNAERQMQRQRVGDGQQWLRRQPVGNRAPGAGAPAGDGGPMAEFKLYLQALGIDQNPPLHDPFPTTSERMYYPSGYGVDGGPGPVRTLSPRDFTSYREERSRLSGHAFASPSTGPVRDPVEAPRDEFIDLIANHGTGHVTPKDVLARNHLRSASPKQKPMVIREPDTELEDAFTSLRKRNMESFISGVAQPARAVLPPGHARLTDTTPATPATPRSSVSSLDSVRSSASSTGSLRDQILAGARMPRGGQSNPVAFNDALEFAGTSLPAASSVDRMTSHPISRRVSLESTASARTSDRMEDEGTSVLPSPRLEAAIERHQKRSQPRVPQLDVSITRVRHVDEKGAPLRGAELAQARGVTVDWFRPGSPDSGAPANPQAALMEDLRAALQERASQLAAS